MVRLLSIVPRRSKSVTSLLIICQRWKFLQLFRNPRAENRANMELMTGERLSEGFRQDLFACGTGCLFCPALPDCGDKLLLVLSHLPDKRLAANIFVRGCP
jgi:hypothetical protein